MKRKLLLTALVSVAAASMAHADIKVGVLVSATGPAASLGIPEKNTIALLPKTVAGQKIDYIVLDDGSDTTKAVTDTKKLISEDKVDAIMGSSITPNSLAMVDVVGAAKTPMISMAASEQIIAPMDANRHWVFKVPQNDSLMADAIAAHMSKAGIKTVAFIGFSDAYGEGWWKVFSKSAAANHLKIVDSERFNRTDTSVTGQVLKIISAHPDAVLVAGAGTPSALPEVALKEQGYKGTIYQTHGVANNDFLRVGGKDVEGTWLPAGPVLVAEQLPASNPIKKVALDYVKRYEAVYGAGSVSTFGAHAWDAGRLLDNAIPVALKAAKPGTEKFRAALRDALESTKNFVGAHGIFNMTPTNHNGMDQRARVMVKIVNGKWKLEQ